MNHPFANVYEDDRRARAYAGLEFPGTYFLAFRDLPELLSKYAQGKTALDFGCGAGRSTRFLKDLGYQVAGVDISEAMLRLAVERDPGGEYLLLSEGNLGVLGSRRFDVVLCAFTFDNVPGREQRAQMFQQLGEHLGAHGRLFNLVSAPEIYVNEWTSFTTLAFPENRSARSGEVVRIIMKDVEDSRPVEDVFWTDDDYHATFDSAGLELLETHRPLGLPTDPHHWVSETTVSPWIIHVLRKR